MNKSLIPAQRRERILEYLSVHHIAHISELSRLLDVSEATVRRDLEWLEGEGILERTHGGAMLNQRVPLEPAYIQRAQRFMEEKRQIGLMAAEQIHPGEVVFINSGTTSTQLIRHIPNLPNLTIITNNLSAALEVGPVEYKLTLLGGDLQPVSNSVTGRFAIENLNKVYADQCFIGVDGFSIKYGCTVPTSSEAEVIRLMMERTHGPITIIMDHSKWGMVSNFQVATIDQIDRLITDDDLDEGALNDLRELGVSVQVVTSTPFKA